LDIIKVKIYRYHLCGFGCLSFLILSFAVTTEASVTNFTAVWAVSPTSSRSGDYAVYVPSSIDVPRVRGVVFLYPGSGGDWRFRASDLVWQEAARSLGFAVIGASNNTGYFTITEQQAEASLNAILATAANVTGRSELANAPIISTGFSLGGFVSTEWAGKASRRVIATVSHRGGNSFSGSDASSTKEVPVLWIPGSLDTNGATSPSVATGHFPGYRSSPAGGRAALAIDWRTGHDSFQNQGWSMAWTWMAESIALRYPINQLPSRVPGNRLTLRSIPETEGWLGQRTYATSSTGGDRTTFTPIAAYANYAGDKFTASWLPNETVARVYRAFNSFDGVAGRSIPMQSAIALVGDTAPSNVVQSGQVNPPQMAM